MLHVQLLLLLLYIVFAFFILYISYCFFVKSPFFLLFCFYHPPLKSQTSGGRQDKDAWIFYGILFPFFLNWQTWEMKQHLDVHTELRRQSPTEMLTAEFTDQTGQSATVLHTIPRKKKKKKKSNTSNPPLVRAFPCICSRFRWQDVSMTSHHTWVQNVNYVLVRRRCFFIIISQRTIGL